MVGYSGTPLVTKLGIKPGHRLALVTPPEAYPAGFGALPEGVVTTTRAARDADVTILFSRSAAALGARFPRVAAALAPGGAIWIAWPKKASGVPTDLTGDVVRGIGLATGLVDVKVCAIDDVWSGLKFVRRRVPRPARTPVRA